MRALGVACPHFTDRIAEAEQVVASCDDPLLGDADRELLTTTAGPIPMVEGAGPARKLLELVAQVPVPVWGRDELGTGDMWNSNSVTSWLLTTAGLEGGRPPMGGRAPGWDAGIAVARRSLMGGGDPGHQDDLAA